MTTVTPPSDKFSLEKISGDKMYHWVVDENLQSGQAKKFASMIANGMSVVLPTQVGYILPAATEKALDKMFELKGRPKTKAGVVLLPRVVNLESFAQTTDDIRHLYAHAEKDDTLLGCILPHNQNFPSFVPEGCLEMMSDGRSTSCFVTRYGTPSEQVVQALWDNHKIVCFASSANPSGKGNRGELAYVGEKILTGVDAIMEGDFYVHGCQPQATAETRAEQGVMVSFVDEDGSLMNIKDNKPRIIRHGHQLEKVKALLQEHFGGYVDAHGEHQNVYLHGATA